ncbi:MAG: EAL domain-containing protein [Alphaproteobacteria bacterium]
MSHAAAFAAEQLRQVLEESRPALMQAKPFATVNRRSVPDVMAVNGLVRVWWDAVVVQPTWNDLPHARRMEVETAFLENIATHEGFTPKLLDYALMSAFFAGFAEAGQALPMARAEAIRAFPTTSGQAGLVASYERLSGVQVAPFLRGRVFQALTKAGLIAKADLLTLMTLVDELEAGGPAAVSDGPHAVNIEPASLLHANDYALLEQEIRRLPKHLTPRLCVEITERGRDNPRLNTIFANLALLRQATGCLLAYDDYRGLEGEDEHLLILQPDSVKLDGTLIRPLLVEPKPDSVAFANGVKDVHSLIQRIATHAPHSKIVAEWAETPAAYQALAAEGVDGIQSYVLEKLAKTMPEVLHLSPETLTLRDTALMNLASVRTAAAAMLEDKKAALVALEQTRAASLTQAMRA